MTMLWIAMDAGLAALVLAAAWSIHRQLREILDRLDDDDR